MSKRPLIFSIVDSEGEVLFSSQDRASTFLACREILVEESPNDIALMGFSGGKVLFSHYGSELLELLEDEDDGY